MGNGIVRLGGALLLGGMLMAAGAPNTLDAQTTRDDRSQVLSATTPGTSPANGRAIYTVPKGDFDIQVDGRLDEAAWQTATAIPIRFEVNPGDNAPAPVATECRLTHDASYLYLGCRAEDPNPESIRAYVVDRDGIDGHDRVTLTLDPFNDQRRAFQFGISALGVQSDAILAQQGTRNPNAGPDGQGEDPSWDAIWNSAGTITEDGYSVEAAIPFRSLRFPASGGQWGAYLTRWWPRSANVEMRSTTLDRNDSCELCQAHLLDGIQGGAPGANVQFTPTATAARSDTRDGFGPGSTLTAGTTDPEFGLDAQWGITSDLTLNLTANPDFSQVEADVAQLDVNNRFALFFPEKRPFFLEGADFFGTPLNAVFTRSIADPIAGAKVTGKLGDQAVGLLVARDRQNHLLIPGSQFSQSTTLEDEVTTAVARFRRDIGGTSTVGALYSGREGTGYHNRVGGFDAFYRPFSSLTVEAQVLRSNTEYPTAVAAGFAQSEDPITGNALQTRATWSTRDWLWNADYRRLDENFRADAGFVTQAGIQGGFTSLARIFRGGSDRWFNEIRVVGGTWQNRDFDGNTTNGGGWVGLMYQGPAQTSLGVWPNFAMTEYYAGESFTGMNHVFFNLSAAPSGTLRVGLNGFMGDQVDYANAAKGTMVSVSPQATLRLGRNVEARLSHSVQRMKRGGANVFTAHLSQLRTVYNFSTRSFLRTVLQFRQTDREPGAYTDAVDPRSRSLFAQVLYAYKVNPQTVLFLGYSQDGSGLTDPEMRVTPLTTMGRTFFVKLGYAWRP